MSAPLLSRIYSAALIGIEAHLIEVEVHISLGLPSWTTVGLPESAVKESKERVISAVHNSSYEFPYRKIIINLALYICSSSQICIMSSSSSTIILI